MKKTLTMLAAAAAMITMQAATSVEVVAQKQTYAVAGEKQDSGLGSMVYGESLDSGLGSMVYGESLDSGLGELTAADLAAYFPPRAVQTASLAN
jgi:hypothetical protein